MGFQGTQQWMGIAYNNADQDFLCVIGNALGKWRIRRRKKFVKFTHFLEVFDIKMQSIFVSCCFLGWNIPLNFSRVMCFNISLLLIFPSFSFFFFSFLFLFFQLYLPFGCSWPRSSIAYSFYCCWAFKCLFPKTLLMFCILSSVSTKSPPKELLSIWKAADV